jgi:uncharacterized protein (TIGR03086 family)
MSRDPAAYHLAMADPVIDDLDAAFDRAATIIAAVPADRYGAPTPCPEMDVRTLINHMVGGNRMFARTARGEELDLTLMDEDLIGDDPVAAYRASARDALEAWQRPGVMDETLGFAGMPGSLVVRLHLIEELVHGWDLARATGQDPTIDAAVSERALATMQQVPTEMLRSGPAFGAEVPIAADAPAGDRLVAFLGRDPAATPA